MKIVVNNKNIFAEILNESTRDFREMISKEAFKKGDSYEFKIEDARPYSIETHTELVPSIKSLYQPLYVLKDNQGNPDNQLEKEFLNYLDSKEMVEWYWENGTELMRVNFGISYNNGMNTFQPDFLVKFKDGSIGIFDTKPVDHRVYDTTVKANALYKYLDDTNSNRGYAPKVIGGIVVKVGSQFYVYENGVYHDYKADHNGWRNFNELLREILVNYEILNSK
jgi:type III restriction enzyme